MFIFEEYGDFKAQISRCGYASESDPSLFTCVIPYLPRSDILQNTAYDQGLHHLQLLQQF